MGERRVLFTKWVGSAWEKISSMKDAIVRSFRKCGISLPTDVSEDSEINIKGVDDYVVGEDSDVVTEDEEDPFSDLD